MPRTADQSTPAQGDFAAALAELDHQRDLVAKYSWELMRLRAIEDERDQAIVDRDEMARSHRPLTAQRDALLTENAGLRARTDELEREVASLRPEKQQLDRIRSSRIWRATVPARRLVNLARIAVRGRP